MWKQGERRVAGNSTYIYVLLLVYAVCILRRTNSVCRMITCHECGKSYVPEVKKYTFRDHKLEEKSCTHNVF